MSSHLRKSKGPLLKTFWRRFCSKVRCTFF